MDLPRCEDARAASGLVNVAHQLGGSLGLGVLVVVFASANNAAVDATAVLAHRIATAFGAIALMLGLALLVVLALIVRPPRTSGCGLAQGVDHQGRAGSDWRRRG